MKTRLFALISTFAVVVMPLAAQAATPSSTAGNRYFIQSTNSIWKGSFGARNEFEDGFTADLSGSQLWLAKLMGLKVYAVKRLNILPDTVVSVDSQKADTDARNKGNARPTPTHQVPWGVAMLDGGNTIPSNGASVSVAILDTGIATTHPDLARRIEDCKDFTGKQAVVDGKCDDQNGHGTHVAGIIAADGGADGKGIYGMDPQASLMAYKVCGANGSCWSDDIAVAIRVAADNGANIINMSLGSDSLSSLISDAITYATGKGVLVVAAAGNDGPYSDSIDYPAALSSVVAVGALDSTEKIPDWSSRGINETTDPYVVNDGDIEFAAPGVNIESTYPGGYAILSGTSMASPHIAGLAAHFWQAGDHAAEATRDLLHTWARAHDIAPAGDDDASGWGLPVAR